MVSLEVTYLDKLLFNILIFCYQAILLIYFLTLWIVYISKYSFHGSYSFLYRGQILTTLCTNCDQLLSNILLPRNIIDLLSHTMNNLHLQIWSRRKLLTSVPVTDLLLKKPMCSEICMLEILFIRLCMCQLNMVSSEVTHLRSYEKTYI